MKTIKKVKVNAKLAKRQFNQADTTDKVGVILVGGFILPMLAFVCLNINEATISFGF